MEDRATAVIVDQWALVRLGIGAVLRSLDIRIVGDESRARDGLLRGREEAATVMVFGSHLDVPVVEAVREAAGLDPRPRILALLTGATRDELSTLFSTGADGALLRSASADELADAVRRLLLGERVLAPAFVPLLAGTMTTASPTTEGGLTAKELEVLALLAQGRSNREIADALFISPATVKTHLEHLYDKLGVRSRQEAVEQALADGLLE